MKPLCCLLTLLILPVASAERIGSMNLTIDKDPITDENQSRMYTWEVNDISGNTFLLIRCIGNEYGLFLQTKNQLYVEEENGEVFETPQITYRFDNKTPVLNVNTGVVINTENGEKFTTALTFDTTKDTHAFIKNARNASKVVLRINRIMAKPLDYTFSLKSFGAALQKMNCPVKL